MLQFCKMPTFFGAALLIIMAIQYWSFRSVQGMLLPMITGILSVLWASGAWACWTFTWIPWASRRPF